MSSPVVDTILTEHAVTKLLASLGEDVAREGLRDTPARVARFYQEFLNPEPIQFTTFENEAGDETGLVVQAGIPFYSLCEHHLVPFFGTAVVGSVPGDRIVGLSKLARVVRTMAANFQNQERITVAVADLLERELKPQGVGVILTARHLCMEMRGVQVPGAETTTRVLYGVVDAHRATREEFLGYLPGGRR
jgi:GTP cyclohydrolase IA